MSKEGTTPPSGEEKKPKHRPTPSISSSSQYQSLFGDTAALAIAEKIMQEIGGVKFKSAKGEVGLSAITQALNSGQPQPALALKSIKSLPGILSKMSAIAEEISAAAKITNIQGLKAQAETLAKKNIADMNPAEKNRYAAEVAAIFKQTDSFVANLNKEISVQKSAAEQKQKDSPRDGSPKHSPRGAAKAESKVVELIQYTMATEKTALEHAVEKNKIDDNAVSAAKSVVDKKLVHMLSGLRNLLAGAQGDLAQFAQTKIGDKMLSQVLSEMVIKAQALQQPEAKRNPVQYVQAVAKFLPFANTLYDAFNNALGIKTAENIKDPDRNAKDRARQESEMHKFQIIPMQEQYAPLMAALNEVIPAGERKSVALRASDAQRASEAKTPANAPEAGARHTRTRSGMPLHVAALAEAGAPGHRRGDSLQVDTSQGLRVRRGSDSTMVIDGIANFADIASLAAKIKGRSAARVQVDFATLQKVVGSGTPGVIEALFGQLKEAGVKSFIITGDIANNLLKKEANLAAFKKGMNDAGIEELQINNTDIKDLGSVWPAVYNIDSVQNLSLKGNKLDNPQSLNRLDSLAKSNIQTVKLSGNGIEEFTGETIAHAIRNNNVCAEVVLDTCPDVAKACQENREKRAAGLVVDNGGRNRSESELLDDLAEGRDRPDGSISVSGRARADTSLGGDEVAPGESVLNMLNKSSITAIPERVTEAAAAVASAESKTPISDDIQNDRFAEALKKVQSLKPSPQGKKDIPADLGNLRPMAGLPSEGRGKGEVERT